MFPRVLAIILTPAQEEHTRPSTKNPRVLSHSRRLRSRDLIYAQMYALRAAAAATAAALAMMTAAEVHSRTGTGRAR